MSEEVENLKARLKTLQSDFDTLKRHATYSYEAMDWAARLLKDSEGALKCRAMLRHGMRKLGFFGAHP